MEVSDLFAIVATLVGLFKAEEYFIKRFVAFVKEVSGLQGNAARLLSFSVGVVFGALILLAWWSLTPGLAPAFYAIIAVFYCCTAGLIASGDYDLNNEA